MDVEEAAFIMGEALGGKGAVVHNALAHLKDEELEEMYEGWWLLGEELWAQMERRHLGLDAEGRHIVHTGEE